MPNDTRITLRLPSTVYVVVKESADKNGRSMNEEIVTALTAYYNVIDELRRRIEQLEAAVFSSGIATSTLPHFGGKEGNS